MPTNQTACDYHETGVETVFRCSLCGKIYDAFFLAEDCYKRHIKLVIDHMEEMST